MNFDKQHAFVANVFTDDFKRSRMFACVYCGDTTSKTRDHVISVSWSGFKRSYEKGHTVPACRECNSLLSNIPLHCISARASWLASRLEKKYRKILNTPYWSKSDLKEMSNKFKCSIKATNDLKHYISSRIAHCVLVGFETINSPKVKQITIDDQKVYKIMTLCFNGKSYKEVEEMLELKSGDVRKILTNKKYASLVITFKWDNKINFDADIKKIFAQKRKERLLSSSN